MTLGKRKLLALLLDSNISRITEILDSCNEEKIEKYKQQLHNNIIETVDLLERFVMENEHLSRKKFVSKVTRIFPEVLHPVLICIYDGHDPEKTIIQTLRRCKGKKIDLFLDSLEILPMEAIYADQTS